MLQLPLNIQLDDSARFENYFAENNQQIVRRLQSISLMSEDFIFIWGGHQTGKTHLAQALCQQASELAFSAAYLPMENPMLNSEILDGMGMMDLVCIDNIDKVMQKSDWEIALFNLFNQLKAERKSLIIFSQSNPKHSTIHLADLQSRLCSMEIYKLDGLQDLQKIELFKIRAANRGLEISDEVVRYILSRHGRSLTELMGILDQLDRSSMILKRKVTIPLVKEIFGEKSN